MSDDNIENILKSSLWMVLLTILMIWAPIVGPIVSGIVGGKRSRGVKNAIAAFSLCALIVFIIFLVISFIVGDFLEPAIVRRVPFAIPTGTKLYMLITALFYIYPIFIGAIVGSALTEEGIKFPKFERERPKPREREYYEKRYYPEERYVPETYLPMERPRAQYDPYYDNYPVPAPRPQIPSLRVRREGYSCERCGRPLIRTEVSDKGKKEIVYKCDACQIMYDLV
ncbi:MAG: hypothetical protein HPY60_04490 [Candidatus Methanofastidiosum sp.]|nr:hypothetical protein [Methanofastidiosum sp.]